MPVYPWRSLADIKANCIASSHEWDTREFIEALKMFLPPWYLNKYFTGGAISDCSLIELRGYAGTIAVGPVILDDAHDGGMFLRYPNPAVAYVLQSASALDDVGNTGATYVHIDYLNAAHGADHVDVAMNGVGQVAALGAGQATAINGMKVVEAGAGRTNAGLITLTDAGVGNELARIPAGTGKSHSCRYHVPVGKNLLVGRFSAEALDCAGAGIGFDLIGTMLDPDTHAASLPGILRDLGPYYLLEGQKWDWLFEEVQIIPASTAAIISEIACWVTGNVAGTDDATASIYGMLVDA